MSGRCKGRLRRLSPAQSSADPSGESPNHEPVTRRRLLKSIGQVVVVAVPTWRVLLSPTPASAECEPNPRDCSLRVDRPDYCHPFTRTWWTWYEMVDRNTMTKCYEVHTETSRPCDPAVDPGKPP